MRFRIKILVMVACLLLLSSVLVVWVIGERHDPVEELSHLHGQTETQVIAGLGTPDQRTEFVLSNDRPLGEFRIEIYNTYDPLDPATEGVVIRELQWDYNDHHETLFLHEVDGDWVVLDSVRWWNDVVF